MAATHVGDQRAVPAPVRGWLVPAGIVLFCALLGAGLYLYASQPLVPPPITEEKTVIDLREFLVTLKLVTVEATADVRASRYYEDWRGSVYVQISVPVQFLYGVDLGDGTLRADEQDDRYVRVVVPPPRCLYTRYDVKDIREEKVEVNGVHTRKGAGQTQLTLCIYENLPEAIEKATIDPRRVPVIRDKSREQIRRLLQVVAPDKWIEIRFSDETDPQPTVDQDTDVAA